MANQRCSIISTPCFDCKITQMLLEGYSSKLHQNAGRNQDFQLKFNFQFFQFSNSIHLVWVRKFDMVQLINRLKWGTSRLHPIKENSTKMHSFRLKTFPEIDLFC